MRESWLNFPKHELVCSCCGQFNPNPEFQDLMDDIQKLRETLGEPLPLGSAYRCPNHPIEKAKEGGPGPHSRAAVDIVCAGEKAMRVFKAIARMDFTGVGIRQKGPWGERIIHVDNDSYRLFSY